MSRRIGLTDRNVVPVSALANRYEVLPLMAQCEGYMKVTPPTTLALPCRCGLGAAAGVVCRVRDTLVFQLVS